MTEKEKAKQALNVASNHELGKLHKHAFGVNPFTNGKLLLPSHIRQEVLKRLFKAIDSGELKFDKQ
jgi:hypothetical protein